MSYLGITLVFVLCFIGLKCENENTFISERLGHGARALLKTQRKTIQMANDIKELQSIEDEEYRKAESCKTCALTLQEVIRARRYGMPEFIFKSSLLHLCTLYMHWDKAACQGFINIEADSILYMIDHNKNLTGARMCSVSMQHSGCKDPDRKDWDIVIPPKTKLKTQTRSSAVPSEGLQVLHLTDFHFDPLYKPGSNAKCKFGLCCQNTSGLPDTPELAAGYWGDYHSCDMPWHSVKNLLSQIKKQHTNIDHIYYTGDIISHRSWDTSAKRNGDAIKMLYDHFYTAFGDVKVYPILGNHESHPTDFWADLNTTDSKISTQWVFNLVAEEWAKWLPPSALETVKQGGYYTVQVKPGFRIIALNSNVCFTANLWLFYKDEDPYGQLQWLADTLKKAEDNNEVVHLLSHVPPGNVECLENWNEVFVKIINRFAPIIQAQFNGHTHLDEFRIFYNDDKTDVINVAYNGGSFTTFVGMNPNYRVYNINSETYMVEDYDQWSYNMTEANLSLYPEWKKLYSFKSAYGVPSMSLSDLGDLVEKMQSTKTLQEQYFSFEIRQSDGAEKCNDTCLQNKACAIKAVHFSDAMLCKDF